ncbi:unnamed protein product [Caenorhabditis angaria]|uniref:DOMON domain-containing protein n=1 Tax=Caenorhabditis angaria TaxID=860376 RepID=A0A9P1N2E6_9PELO|nr:unnamed protein product [Caenorhabditis angaria]
MNSTISLIFFACFVALASAKTCKYTSGDLNVHWIYANNSIQIQFQNKNLKNDHWTGIGFGNDKNNIPSIIFLLTNNVITTRSVTLGEETAPVFTNTNSSNTNYQLIYSGYFPQDKTINAVLNVSPNFGGQQLTQCQKWNFFKKGKISNGNVEKSDNKPSKKKVCATQCQ